jgi:hypothetical protein
MLFRREKKPVDQSLLLIRKKNISKGFDCAFFKLFAFSHCVISSGLYTHILSENAPLTVAI